MSRAPSAKRIKELEDLAKQHLGNNDHFDYYNWDGLIEDETLTHKELEWMEENFRVVVTIERIKENNP